MKTPIKKDTTRKFFSKEPDRGSYSVGSKSIGIDEARNTSSTVRRIKKYLSELDGQPKKREWLENRVHIGVDELPSRLSRAVYQYDSMTTGSIAYFRKSQRQDDVVQSDVTTVLWLMYVEDELKKHKTKELPDLSRVRLNLTDENLRQILKLSVLEDGPLKAVTALFGLGVLVLVVPGPSGIAVDGLSMLSVSNRVSVVLTLRHDRLDNFWFTLFHELAHVRRHLGSSDSMIIDDLEKISIEDVKEREANRIARDIMVPRPLWRRTKAFKSHDADAVISLANELAIDPSIIAGRIRYETGRFDLLSNMVGQGRVRNLFGF